MFDALIAKLIVVKREFGHRIDRLEGLEKETSRLWSKTVVIEDDQFQIVRRRNDSDLPRCDGELIDTSRDALADDLNASIGKLIVREDELFDRSIVCDKVCDIGGALCRQIVALHRETLDRGRVLEGRADRLCRDVCERYKVKGDMSHEFVTSERCCEGDRIFDAKARGRRTVGRIETKVKDEGIAQELKDCRVWKRVCDLHLSEICEFSVFAQQSQKPHLVFLLCFGCEEQLSSFHQDCHAWLFVVFCFDQRLID